MSDNLVDIIVECFVLFYCLSSVKFRLYFKITFNFDSALRLISDIMNYFVTFSGQ